MARNINKSTEWEAFYLQNQPSYHEFYGLYTSIARNIAGRPSGKVLDIIFVYLLNTFS